MKPLSSVKLMVATLPLLLLGGCLQDDSSPEACAYDATMALDQGQYDKAISLLDKSSCKTAFTEDERNLNLAAAYIGRAGYDLMDLITDIVNSDEGDNALTTAFAANAKASGMNDLEKAKNYYITMLQTQINASANQKLSEACDSIKTDTHSDTRLKRNACFNNGLVAAAKAGTSVSMLFGGQENKDELDAWLNKEDGTVYGCDVDLNQNGQTDFAEITSCAMKFAHDGTQCFDATTSSEKGFPEHDGSTTYLTISEKDYSVAKVEITAGALCTGTDEKVGYRLFTLNTTTPNFQSLVTTDGYCKVDAPNMTYTLAQINSDDTLTLGDTVWPCPVAKENGEPLTLTDSLITAINEDAETLIQMLPAEDQDVSAIDEFKDDLCSVSTGTSLCGGDSTNGWTVTEAALIEYLNKN